MTTKVARKWDKVARFCLGISAVARLSLECQAFFSRSFHQASNDLLGKLNSPVEVENRLRNAKRAIFSMWLHHCLTRYGGFLAVAKTGETPREAVFSDSCRLRRRRTKRQSLTMLRRGARIAYIPRYSRQNCGWTSCFASARHSRATRPCTNNNRIAVRRPRKRNPRNLLRSRRKTT